jgi:F0F1-type ATP synthase membrane subunit a
MTGKVFESIFSFLGTPGTGVYISSALSHNFPVIIPIFLYLEEIMVSFIQAMVFALLVSIFIKVALAELENEEEPTSKKTQVKI